MTGMKEGPGSDPFADDDTDEQSDESTESDESTYQNDRAVQPMATTDIPYIIRRQTVKEERNDRHTYFLRQEFVDAEDDLHDAVAAELDMRAKDVSTTDLREAIVAVAAEHEEEVAEKLREWGIEHLK